MKAMVKLLPVFMIMAIADPILADDDSIEVPRALSMRIETGFTFEERFVRIILPANFYASHHKRLPLVLHLHGSIPDPNVPELELDNLYEFYPECTGERRQVEPPHQGWVLWIE